MTIQFWTQAQNEVKTQKGDLTQAGFAGTTEVTGSPETLTALGEHAPDRLPPSADHVIDQQYRMSTTRGRYGYLTAAPTNLRHSFADHGRERDCSWEVPSCRR